MEFMMKDTDRTKTEKKKKKERKGRAEKPGKAVQAAAQSTATATPRPAPPAAEVMRMRQEQLMQAAAELKQELFGIDHIIDQTIQAIRAWYVWPELINRPVIVSLWGLTGTGKTQLVRSLVRKLGFYRRFAEVQMDGFSNSGRHRHDTICGILAEAEIQEGEPGVLLLDEFQRYRTVDARGQDVKTARYQDVWTLLSDGKLSPKLSFLSTLEHKLANLQYEHADRSGSAKRKQTKNPFRLDAWDARDLKHALKLKEPLLEVMRWSADEVRLRVEQLHQSESHWETDYSKLLIFVAGNLDEMYSELAQQVQDCDTDADVFHRMTRQLSVIDVKKALTERFRPEQIARLGNCHIIYPSLSRDAYVKLIQRSCNEYIEEIAHSAGIAFALSGEVLEEIYHNGVFPAQGTRPVFSTVHNVLSNTLVQAALWVLETAGARNHPLPDAPISLELDRRRENFVLNCMGASCTLPAHLHISGLRRRKSDNFRTLLAVHEAGHALVYAMLMRCPPQEVRINVASFEGGYNSYISHKAYSKRMWLNRICVSLAGRVAESRVFGEDAVTTGAYEDVRKATAHAAQFVRHHAFGERISHTDVCTEMDENVNTDVEPTNDQVEALLQAQQQRAQQVLREHADLFRKLVAHLLQHGFITAPVFADMAQLPHSLPQEDTIEPYHAKWQEFAAKAV